MNGNSPNGKTTAQAPETDSLLPDRPNNPFRQPAWPRPIGPDNLLPARPGPGATKKLLRTYDEGEVQILEQAIQRAKGIYAVGASAQVHDFANHCFTRVGTNIVVRIRANPYPELTPYLESMMDAQLLDMGRELNQISNEHARSQNEILGERIEVEQERRLSFAAKLLSGLNKDS